MVRSSCRSGRDAKWALGLWAARVFHDREGDLRVPRKHVEHLGRRRGTRCQAVRGADEAVVMRLGTWVDNTRRLGDKLAEERRADLDAFGMRW
ncbi:helicase associated domain-containing protein [Streptomyces sp. NPDC002561]|uniref:helicase associated domain-containing protein n=1 Tax=Streptomyces sp. NPDC002561 TaxID=3154418 RepID=UPI003325A82C